jgi:hypothetical protein
MAILQVQLQSTAVRVLPVQLCWAAGVRPRKRPDTCRRAAAVPNTRVEALSL